MDNAKYGIIYFSLGSILKSRTMPVKLRRELLDMLGGLKQTIIWKLEEDMPDNKYKNVHVVSYAPQQSILGEKNPTAFIKKKTSR